MPCMGDAHRRSFYAKLKRGEIKRSVVDEYDKASKGKDLPERKGKNKK